MKILFCTSECVPFAASGGLGDVAGSLPKRLNKSGADVRVVMPLYKGIKEKYKDKLKFLKSFYVPLAWRNQYCGVFTLNKDGTEYYFLDNEYYFMRADGLYGYYDDGERFAFFSKAILEAILQIDFAPDIIHANDWQTALVCTYLNIYYRQIPKMQNIKTVFTIHNILYQGRFGMNIAGDVLGIPDEWFGHVEYGGDVNFMKSAIEDADFVSTVSPTYANEILIPYYAHGLDGILREKQYKIHGILNGIDYDKYNPKTDDDIAKNYHKKAFTRGKAACKENIRDYFELEKDSSPIISMITRLVSHKGVDIAADCMRGLLDMGYQVIVLGSGDYMYEDTFRRLSEENPGRMGAEIGFIPKLAKRIYSASDMFLMPSQTEPCGLSQMIAMRYGAIPIVRKTGGLADSVKDSSDGVGCGFVFEDYSADALYHTCRRAFQGFKDKKGWKILTARSMGQDNSWKNSSKKYLQMYTDCVNLW
jgi:starch synthase